MSALPLTQLTRAARPASREALRQQIDALPLPERSAALLARAGYGLRATATRQEATAAAANAAVGAGLARLVEMLGAGATDAEGYRGAVASLVGLGPGLTPTGDDLLVALLATSRRLVAGSLVSSAAADQLAAAVAEIPAGRTTAVAHHLLSEATAGRFPRPLADLVGVLGDPGVDRDTLAGLVDRLVATGAHSGCDWLSAVVALACECVGRGYENATSHESRSAVRVAGPDPGLRTPDRGLARAGS